MVFRKTRSGKAGSLAVAAVLILVTSCRTLPENPDPGIVNWLPEGTDVVFLLSVPDNRELAGMLASLAGLDGAESEKVLERTAMVAFGMEADSRAVHAAAVGLWPQGVMGGALGPEWSRSPDGRHRWDGPGGLEMAVVTKREILLSSGRVAEMTDRRATGERTAGISRSEDVVRGADLTVWILDPVWLASAVPTLPLTDRGGNPLLSSAALTLRRRDDVSYDLSAHVYTVEEELSRSLALLLRLALSARFGMSPDPADRELLSRTEVDSGPGEVRIFMPDLSLEFLRKFSEGVKFVPEVGS